MDDLLKLNCKDKKLIEAFRTYEEYKDAVSNKKNLLDQMVFQVNYICVKFAIFMQ